MTIIERESEQRHIIELVEKYQSPKDIKLLLLIYEYEQEEKSCCLQILKTQLSLTDLELGQFIIRLRNDFLIAEIITQASSGNAEQVHYKLTPEGISLIKVLLRNHFRSKKFEIILRYMRKHQTKGGVRYRELIPLLWKDNDLDYDIKKTQINQYMSRFEKYGIILKYPIDYSDLSESRKEFALSKSGVLLSDIFFDSWATDQELRLCSLFRALNPEAKNRIFPELIQLIKDNL